MAIERTFGMIKPDATSKLTTIGDILFIVEDAGYRIVYLRMVHLPKMDAETLYAAHKDRPYFNELIDFTISGPCVLMALEGENAIAGYRRLMGATNSENASPESIRGQYGNKHDIKQNAVHGSDGPEAAKIELAYFFNYTK